MSSVAVSRSLFRLRLGAAFWWAAVAATLVAGALVAIAVFDLGPPQAYSDDWIYAWQVRQLVSGHGLRIFPEASAASILQTLWAAVATFGQANQAGLRLSALPFLAAAAASVYWISRWLGANRYWSFVGAGALACSPYVASVSTTFMTEPFYLGLLLVACALCLNWLRYGKNGALVVVICGLACLERQHAMGIVVALSVTALMTRRSKPGTWFVVGGAWAASFAALLLPLAFGVAPAEETAARIGPLLNGKLDFAAYSVVLLFLPGMAGMLLLPFGLGMLSLPRQFLRGGLRLWLTAVAVAAAALVVMAAQVLNGHQITLGNDWNVYGLGPLSITGHPQLFPGALLAVIQAAAILTVVGVAVGGMGLLRRRRPSPAHVFLVLITLTQLAITFTTGALERYYLPMLAPLIPIAALIATKQDSSLARAWAVAFLAIGLGVYLVGEQDFQAWQQARDEAAQQALATMPADKVDGGYEVTGVYIDIPHYDRFGSMYRSIEQYGTTPDVLGPLNPSVRLTIASVDDPTPGKSYRSLAPAKVVIRPILS